MLHISLTGAGRFVSIFFMIFCCFLFFLLARTNSYWLHIDNLPLSPENLPSAFFPVLFLLILFEL